MTTHAELQHLDRGWFSARVDTVAVTYMDGRVDDASYDRFLLALGRDIDAASLTQRRGVIYETPNPGSVSAERRKKLGALLNARREALARITSGYALVTPSAIARGIVTAVFWLAPPPYETRVCENLTEALRWLEPRLPGLDPRAFERDYLAMRTSALADMQLRFG